MTIEAHLQADVVVVDANATAADAARAMRDRNVGAVIVVSGLDGTCPRLEGMVTDRDLALGIVAVDGVGADGSVASFTHRPLLCVARTASVAEAAGVMRAAGVRRLVVVDEHNAMIGVVSLDDLLVIAAEMLQDLAGCTRGARDRSPYGTRRHGQQAAPGSSITVPSELAALWRHVVQP